MIGEQIVALVADVPRACAYLDAPTMTSGLGSIVIELLAHQDEARAVYVPTLVRMLSHVRPIIRESAVIALSEHLGDVAIRAAVQAVATGDASPAVREQAAATLADAA